MTDAAIVVTRAQFRRMGSEHEHIQALLGELEDVRDPRARFGLLVALDDAFFSHNDWELELLKKTAPNDSAAFVRSDERDHYTIADLLLQLRDLELSYELFKVKVSLFRRYMREHMTGEESYLRSQMNRQSQRRPSGSALHI